MATDQIEERPGFSDLLAELSDSDIVLEVAAGAGSRRPPELGRVRELEEAIEASYRALAGSTPVQLD
jgi:hypothetical protein